MKFDPESNLPLRSIALLLLVVAISSASLFAKTVVFWQPGFPVLDSQPVDRAALTKALDGMSPVFADVAALKDSATLADADLLVLPYGSSVPVDAWQAIERYLQPGGNLLIVGGQPLHVPVVQTDGKFQAQRPQDTYSRNLHFEHTSEVPVAGDAQFRWREGYPWPAIARLRARRYFAVEGRLDGLAYMVDRSGLRMAAPVIVAGHGAGRVVCVDFDPEPGYWESEDGIALVRQAASYAMQGAIELSVETLFSTLRPGEPPVITAHISSPGPGREQQHKTASGELKLTLADEKGTIDSASVPVTLRGAADVPAPFHKALPAGFYTISATYGEGGEFRAFYRNGFFVADANHVASGPVLGVRGDFLTRDGAPFFPVGTNYFSTESNGWDFSGPRNAWVWDKDFAEMAQHGVTFVRTGVWMPYGRFIDGAAGGGANERFLRNVEAFLLAARRHNIAVNFTFFAFAPRTGIGPWREENAPATPPNPYLDPAELRMEQAYVRSVVERFKEVPWLTWDLINEPSFSNPRAIFKGNSPNGDPAEVAAWRKWLRRKYDGKLAALADAWAVPEHRLGSFDAVSLPAAPTTLPSVTAIRARCVLWRRGRLLHHQSHLLAGRCAAVGFHRRQAPWAAQHHRRDGISAGARSRWSLALRRVHGPGTHRTQVGAGIRGGLQRRRAVGLGSRSRFRHAAQRRLVEGLGEHDARHGRVRAQSRSICHEAATARGRHPAAAVLPIIGGQQVRSRGAAERGARSLGLRARRCLRRWRIPDRFAGIAKIDHRSVSHGAYRRSLDRDRGAREGGRGPAHNRAIRRRCAFPCHRPQDAIGMAYSDGPLTIREHVMHFPGGGESLTLSGVKTTFLSRAVLPNAEDWMEKPLGSGRILFSALPLELNDNLRAVGDVYRYALKTARIAPAYSTAMNDAGILVCPTRFPGATLYVITSESDQAAVSFEDARSGKRFDGTLQPGRAAMLLVGADGKLVASYNWTER